MNHQEATSEFLRQRISERVVFSLLDQCLDQSGTTETLPCAQRGDDQDKQRQALPASCRCCGGLPKESKGERTGEGFS